MNWRIIAIPASMIPIIIIAIQFDIKAEDVFAIGAIPFAGAVVAMMIKLGLQGIKFSYIARHFLGPLDSIWKMSGVRVGSEFIKFTTPMFVGAEFVVIYWMHKKGVSPSKAMWVAILDIVTEVFAGGLLSIMAGIIALLMGAYVVATIILGTSVFVTSLWMILFFLSSKRTFQIPKAIASLVTKFGKEKGKQTIKQTNTWMEEVCSMSRKNLKTKESKKIFANGFALSIVSWIFYGLSFMIIASGIGYEIGPFDSVMAVMGANAIGNLPITVGGSGLAEF
ncbi:MAG: YbhN family protein, partial [Nitrosopumilaceae archaeon]